MALSPETLREKLRTDPDYIIEAIVNNNTEDVIANAQSMGYKGVDDEEGVWMAINDILEDNERPEDEIERMLSVDFRPEQASEELQLALEDLAKNGDIQPPGHAIGLASTESGGQNGGSSFQTEDYLRGLSGALSGLLAGGQQVQDPGNPYGSSGAPRKQKSMKDYLPWIIAAIIVVVLVILLIRKS